MLKLPRRRDSWWIFALLILGLAAIIFGAWRAHLTGDAWFDGLWLEVAKAGVQVVSVGVLGGALAAFWHNITSQREARAKREAEHDARVAEEAAEQRDRDVERNDKIRAELASLVALYNGVKSVRRIVRSLGLDLKTYPEAERATARQNVTLTRNRPPASISRC